MGLRKFLGVIWLFALYVPIGLAQAPDLATMDIVLKSIPDGPVAKVFGKNVSKEDYVRLYTLERDRMSRVIGSAGISEEDRVNLGIWCLHRLVEQELLYQEGLRVNIQVTQREIEDAWTDQLATIRSRFSESSGPALNEKEMMSRVGLASRREALDEVKRALIIVRMHRRIVEESDVTIDEATIENEYNENRTNFNRPARMHLRQIFVRAKPGNTEATIRQREDARTRAEDVLNRIYAGQSFEALVRSVSEAPDGASGGDIGPAPVNTMPPLLVKAGTSLEIGDVSEIIESEYGFHIVKLIALEQGGAATLDDVGPLIRNRLLAYEGEQAVREYCQRMLSGPGDVEMYLELEKNLVLSAQSDGPDLN
ncbi:MAG: peptidylprolyl isomerase [Candidatus Hydrogenedentes bacterium]|nr:peptidylprolyl isomerase [Candidatus Hydrogenedentota bacterium]